jgi:hypothetical protein
MTLTDAALLAIIPGAVLLAIIVDGAALVAFVRSRWREVR